MSEITEEILYQRDRPACDPLMAKLSKSTNIHFQQPDILQQKEGKGKLRLYDSFSEWEWL
jgi:hypothetical protein